MTKKKTMISPTTMAKTEPRDSESGQPMSGASRLAWAVLLVTIVLATIADLGTKHLAFRHLADQPVIVDPDIVRARMAIEQFSLLNVKGPIDPAALAREGVDLDSIDPVALSELIPAHDATVVIPNVLEFTLVLNPGAVFGSAAGGRWYFVGFTVIAVAVALFIFAKRIPSRDRLSQISLGLVIAGGLGNLYDRILFACVRDFLHPLPGVKMPFGLPGLGPNGEIWPYVSNVADAFLLIGIGVLIIRLWREDTKNARTKEDENTEHKEKTANTKKG